MTIKSLRIFIIVDLVVIASCVLLGEFIWLLNTQVAFISSMVVTFATYLGYKKNIQSRVENHINDDDSYDELDKMDDKYDLYSPDTPELQVEEELTKEQIKEEINKSKQSLKKNNTKNFISGLSGMGSIYRIVGYALLIFGFFFLNNNGYLHIFSYIFGFTIIPISALIINSNLRKENYL